MTDDEFDRWCMVAHDCVTGMHVTIVCRDMMQAGNNFWDCKAVFDRMGLAYRSCRRSVGSMSLVVGESIMDGGVDFTTMQKERLTCGDERDVLVLRGTSRIPEAIATTRRKGDWE